MARLIGGTGADTLTGGSDDDVLDGAGAADILTGGAGNDSFRFTAGQGNGDVILDFAGNGAAAGDRLQFFGYGLASEGATFTQVDATHWRINSADGTIQEVITVANGAAIDASDYAFATTYTPLANSSFLDLNNYRTNAVLPTDGTTVTAPTVLNVALILERANDPTALLDLSWAARQQQISALNGAGTMWTTYGADATKYAQVQTALGTLGIQTVDQVDPANGYISSAASRTLWVQVTQDNFSTLFGPDAVLKSHIKNGETKYYWTGDLSLPSALAGAGVEGLWFDTDKFTVPVPQLPSPPPGVTLPQGHQSPGNGAGNSSVAPFPQTIADKFYNFPFSGALWNPSSGSAVATGTIGLVEPGVGTSLPGDNPGAGFQSGITTYRNSAGISTGTTIISVAPGGQVYSAPPQPAFNPAGERSLDVSVVTAINPQSTLTVYAGSGTAAGAGSNAYTAYQSSFWDTTNNPQVITSSFGFASQTSPGSPFYKAARELFVDAALRNITVFNDNGDGGSGNMLGNGVTNVSTSRASPYAVMVGGTSVSTVASAEADATLSTVVNAALAGDKATIWQLVAAGLITSPVNAEGSSAKLIETVWNKYVVSGTSIGTTPDGTGNGYIHNNTGSGGVDPSQPAPSYQTAFGLAPRTSDPSALPGRGTPDVAANAGGNMLYFVANPALTANQRDDGTSAATPLWAALASQIDAIFADQVLPQLGYINDLLYIAAAIAPASFNDITVGSNTSSYFAGGPYTSDGQQITPTGYGYSAAAGYDLVSGLGTPNGTLLARALTTIAHSQTSFAATPDLIDSNGTGGWTSGATQTLLVQANYGYDASLYLQVGSQAQGASAGSAMSFAWTARLAQQSLQADFDPDLVRMFDKQSQGTSWQTQAAAGDLIVAFANGTQAQAQQATLTSAFGFADFFGGGGALHLARPVAVAETVGAQDNQNAVVRMRQGGQDEISLQIYRVDDYTGKIGTLQPGAPGYTAAAEARAYQTTGGATWIEGPGYGNYTQTQIVNVDAGDLLAMRLYNETANTVFWAFSQANGDGVQHLWNYGVNTWGWEDLVGGGDRDYNDLIVQLDFTSAYGHGWLV